MADSQANAQPQSMDWALWFYWIIATTSGWLMGNLFFSGIPLVISGMIIAALQWAVLYKRIDKAWQWFMFSSLTWMATIVGLVLFFPSADSLLGPFLGAALGITQWLILRRHFNWSGWWILISVIAWSTGLTILPGVFTSGTLPGALTGITLVIFFRFSLRAPAESEENGEIQPIGN